MTTDNHLTTNEKANVAYILALPAQDRKEYLAAIWIAIRHLFLLMIKGGQAMMATQCEEDRADISTALAMLERGYTFRHSILRAIARQEARTATKVGDAPRAAVTRVRLARKQRNGDPSRRELRNLALVPAASVTERGLRVRPFAGLSAALFAIAQQAERAELATA